MSGKLPDAFALSEVEARWPQICNEILCALGLTEHKSEDFQRLGLLYERCLKCVPGFREKTIDFPDLHKCVLLAIRVIEHKWPNVSLKELRTEMEETLQPHFRGSTTDQAANIAVCLWLGVDCVGPEHSMPKGWPEMDSVHHFVLNRKFDDPAEASIGDPVGRFPPKFRAARLEEISGISIESTDYLDQHLRFNEDTRTLKVFMDAAWLHAMCDRFRTPRNALSETCKDASHKNTTTPISGSQASSSTTSSSGQDASKQSSQENGPSDCGVDTTTPAPDERIALKPGPCDRTHAAKDLLPLFAETLRTLDVLFPTWDPRTIEFVDNMSSNSNITSSFKLMDLYPQQPQGLTKFKFWRARLTELIVEHQSPPHDWRQIWKDRRNPTAYWTFWIGMMIFLLTLVFGVIASVLAVLTYQQAKSSTASMPPRRALIAM